MSGIQHVTASHEHEIGITRKLIKKGPKHLWNLPKALRDLKIMVPRRQRQRVRDRDVERAIGLAKSIKLMPFSVEAGPPPKQEGRVPLRRSPHNRTQDPLMSRN